MRNKLLKYRKITLTLGILFIVLGLSFTVVEAFYRPTSLNKFIASKLYSEPANTSFTDQSFYNCVINSYNNGHNTSHPYTYILDDEELETITVLNCTSYYSSDENKINDVTGIEKMPALIELNIRYSNLTELDLSNNSSLLRVDVSQNKLTSLNLSNNNLLTSLDASRNALTSLELSNNRLLTTLNVEYNDIEEINVSNNVALTTLNVYDNDLTELDISNNKALVTLEAGSNDLTELDVSNNKLLTGLSVYWNYLEEIDLSNNTALLSLNVGSNGLAELDLSSNKLLTSLYAGWNYLEKIDLSNNTLLTQLDLSENYLAEIDVSNNTLLTELDVYWNELTKIDVSKNVLLIDLCVNSNYLTEIDVSQNVALKGLDVSWNQLSDIDISKNTALLYLDVGGNGLETVDISKNTLLTSLCVDNNNLTEIDITKLTDLQDLDVSDNNLSELDISNNTNLYNLYASSNNLTELDVSNNTTLYTLSINGNAFNNKVYTYKLEDVNVNDYTVPVTLYSTKTISFSTISSNSNINSSNNIYNVKYAGKYDVSVNYTHNIATYSNTFSVNYETVSVELLSDSYYIDNENDKIYIPHNSELAANNISISAGDYTLTSEDKVIGEYENNKLTIKHVDDVLKEFTVEEVSLTSSTYNIDNTLDYIYIGLPEIELSNISSNIGTLNYNSRSKKLEVKVNDLVVDSYDLIMIESNKYSILKDYIFIGNNTFSYDDLSVSNASYNFNNNKIEITKDSNTLDTLDLLSISFGNLTVKGKYIVLNEAMSYTDFVSEISSSDVTYKIYNNNTEVTSGNVEIGMTLKVYKNSTLIYTYNISDEYYDLGSLDIDSVNNYVTDLEDKTSVLDFTNEIDTNGSISIIDKDNNTKSSDSNIATGDKIKITLSNEVIEYTLVVKGDVDGDGEAGTGDAYSIILHVLGKNELTGAYKEAGIIDDEDEPTTGDAYSIILYVLGKKNNL